MADETKSALSQLRDDFTAIEGKPFNHFFCPILWKDEAAELCRGHVVNESFGGSVDTVILQRKDVDGFYGRVVEAEFQALIALKEKPFGEPMFDSKLNRTIRPRITIDGEDCRYYIFKGHKAPAHTLVRMERRGGSTVDLVVQKSPSDLAAADGKKCQLIIEGDYRIAALASLIKAAHLTLFYQLGYRYALSAAGAHIGHAILGTFFMENCNKSTLQARRAAASYFPEFATMVRPLELARRGVFRGTVEDNQLLAFYASSGTMFAIGVFVRTNELLHCVLIPNFEHADAVPIYLDFLANSNEWISAKVAMYDRGRGCWQTNNDKPIPIMWPKGGEGFRPA